MEHLLREGVTPARVASLVEKQGIAFEVTAEVEAQLRQAGADDRVMLAVRGAALEAARKNLEAEQQRRALEPEGGEDERSVAAEAAPAAATRRTQVGQLIVRSNVSGDVVTIDGAAVGPSGPRAHALAPGRHTVTVSKRGYRTAEQEVALGAGETRQVRFRLVRDRAARAAAPGKPRMVKVRGGPFFMGCNERVDTECDDDEKPGRTVNVSTYWIDKTEVTVAQYAGCVHAGGCSAAGLTMPYWDGQERPDSADFCNWAKPGRELHPINCVDWYQARAYCAWAGKRLPTEAEWEKAARGTDGRKYPWGNAGYGVTGHVANVEGESDGYAGTAPVGSYPRGASPCGALEMMGNVWEWVTDPVENGRGVRGGSWSDEPGHTRASNRGWVVPQVRDESVGVRCVR